MLEQAAEINARTPVNEALLLFDRPVDELYVIPEEGPHSLASRGTIFLRLFVRGKLDASIELDARPLQPVARLQDDRFTSGTLAPRAEQLEDIPSRTIEDTAPDKGQIKAAHAGPHATDTRR